jgi:hypothetical protein
VKTDCTVKQLEFGGVGGRHLVMKFDGEHVSSDGGLPLLGKVDQRFGLLKRMAGCFHDLRDPALVEHSVEALLRQRVFGIACGYEDLADHASLRVDPLLAAVVGKDPEETLASPSTLNRLELTPADATVKSRYRKVVYDEEKLAALFVDVFLDAHQRPPKQVVLDLDATDDPIHGTQEGRFFHGYYNNYCYLPLYIFAGSFLLCAKLRTADQDGAAGALDEVKRIVATIRERWPTTQVVLRADSGFARDELMTWCEESSVEYVFGLARNSRLEERIASALEQMREESERTGKPARTFRELRYRTLDSWSRERRVVAKAEHLKGDKPNPRFVVTSFSSLEHEARALYEDLYCARGDMENRIKEQQLDLYADRTSAHTMRANQLRLWFSSMAYVLVNHLRHFGLRGTELEHAQAGTIRTRLLKIGAVVTLSVRRIVLSLSAATPVRELLVRIAAQVAAAPG